MSLESSHIGREDLALTGFEANMKQLLRTLEKKGTELQAGPSFVVTRGDKPPLQVTTFVDGKYYYVIGSVNGQFVGRRVAERSDKMFNIEFNGHIHMSPQHPGFSNQLEQAFHYLLQTVADAEHKKVTVFAENQNRREMELSDMMGVQDQAAFAAEQKRWQSMWGAEGKLGFKKVPLKEKGYKDFKPRRSTPLKARTEVHLSVSDTQVKGRTLSVPAVTQIVPQPEGSSTLTTSEVLSLQTMIQSELNPPPTGQAVNSV
jgi:hypothetical protein